MGWLKPKPTSTSEVSSSYRSNNPTDLKKHTILIDSKDQHDSSAQHLESIDSHTGAITADEPPPLYPFQPTTLKDADLPFIPSIVVSKSLQTSRLVWIVVDNTVYDCTAFLHRHPGGNTVIESFAGQDCSWQFWRFHNRQHMRDPGLTLRIGRTAGVRNRFAERPRFVGLRNLDGWG